MAVGIRALAAVSAPLSARRCVAVGTVALALSGCAGASRHVPDMPFATKDVCAQSAVPGGWIRTNDWRAKGCGDRPGAKANSAKGNNWMAITDLEGARIGRSLTACAGAVPEGWAETARYWDKGRCGNPPKPSEKNVMLIERVE